MKFDTNQKPELGAAKKDVRYYLNGCAVFETVPHHNGPAIVSTDDHMLTVIPCELEPEDIHHARGTTDPAIITHETIAEARKATRGAIDKGSVVIGLRGNEGTKGRAVVEHRSGRVVADDLIDGRFPDAARVIPADMPAVSFAVNAELLARAQKALGSEYINVHVRPEKPEAPLLITPYDSPLGGYAVVMPVRID